MSVMADLILKGKIQTAPCAGAGMLVGDRGGATIGAGKGGGHAPPLSNFSVFTVLTPHLAMH